MRLLRTGNVVPERMLVVGKRLYRPDIVLRGVLASNEVENCERKREEGGRIDRESASFFYLALCSRDDFARERKKPGRMQPIWSMEWEATCDFFLGRGE